MDDDEIFVIDDDDQYNEDEGDDEFIINEAKRRRTNNDIQTNKNDDINNDVNNDEANSNSEPWRNLPKNDKETLERIKDKETLERIKKKYDSDLIDPKQNIAPFTTNNCGGRRVNGLSTCVVIPLEITDPKDVKFLQGLHCRCNESIFVKHNCRLYYDLLELVLKHRLHLHIDNKVKTWESATKEFFNRPSMKKFKPIVSLSKKFDQFITFYTETFQSDSICDPKRTSPFHILAERIIEQMQNEPKKKSMSEVERKACKQACRNHYLQLSQLPNSHHYQSDDYEEDKKAKELLLEYNQLFDSKHLNLKEVFLETQKERENNNSLFVSHGSSSIGNNSASTTSSDVPRKNRQPPSESFNDSLTDAVATLTKALANRHAARKTPDSSITTPASSGSAVPDYFEINKKIIALGAQIKEINNTDFLDDDLKKQMIAPIQNEIKKLTAQLQPSFATPNQTL